MLSVRRALQIVAFVATLMVGVIAISLIVSQTPWFRDWLRRYIVREANQYLNGELAIGGLAGNLFFGVDLTDVSLNVSGQHVISIKTLQVDYSVFNLTSRGIVIDDIKLTAPAVHVVRDADGWNLGRLVRKQTQEADRRGPMRPVSLPSIEVTDGAVSIDDRVGSARYTLPRQIDGLHIKGGFEYAPVHYSITLEDLRFRGADPDLTVQRIAGGLAVRDDNFYLDRVAIRTDASAFTVDGVIEQYLRTPVLKLAAKGNASLLEIGRVATAVEGYAVTPVFDVKANGPVDRLGLDLDVESEAGKVRGQVTADLRTPDIGVRGGVELGRLNLAPILKNAAQKSDITGHATIDLTLASAPESAPVMERLHGTYSFAGPHALALGYEGSNVRVKGALQGRRITLDGRADGYGATATATGFIVTPAAGQPLSFDLQGQAQNVDLRRLPASTHVPRLDSRFAASRVPRPRDDRLPGPDRGRRDARAVRN